jgi:adenine-specific DNA-methyltransferase
MGGKRKLVKAIFKVIPPANTAPVFADAFMGGGAVSLMAKALGYQVKANDIAERSYIVGKALIENNKVKLEQPDIWRILSGPVGSFVQENFCPQVFLTKHAVFLDQATAAIEEMDDSPKKWLSLLLLIKFIFYVRPYSKFSSPNAFNIPMEERRIEYIKQRTYYASIKAALRPIVDVLNELVDVINAGVIDNSRENEMHKLDAREFLRGVTADVAYFDPPYAGTSDYNETYHVLDQILEGRTFPAEKSEFSRKDGYRLLKEVFEAARHIPVWVLSMGNAGGKNECMAELIDMMSTYREVKPFRIKYRHSVEVASEEHKAKNEEYLLLGIPRH